MAVVEIANLGKAYETGGEVTQVLKDLHLEASKGEMILIMGPSGSGKTTLLNLLGGIDRPNKGVIRVAGQTVTDLVAKDLSAYRREKVGFIFQFYNLLPTLTALENVELGLESVVEDRKALTARAAKYLKLVGLADKADNFPQELSAGQQQRVAVARALAKEPLLVLADEPTGNLDEDRARSVMDLMKRLQTEMGITFLIVSHNTALKGYVDRTLILSRGKLHVAS